MKEIKFSFDTIIYLAVGLGISLTYLLLKLNFFLQLHVHKFTPRATVCALFARHTCLDETKLLSYVIFPLVVKLLLEDT